MEPRTFPEGFLFGTATASYQVEGAVEADGRGQSTWDSFVRRPGKVKNNDNGDRSCDQYHLFREDIALMKALGLNAYRFSLAWPRILPDGEGEPNRRGLAYYDRLVDGLLEAGITPYCTLFHWDLPQSLQDRTGGWKSRDTAAIFADYAGLCARELGDRIRDWATINEVVCFTILAHVEDRHAPGGGEGRKVAHQAVHHALLGHGLALRAIRAERKVARVGIVENLNVVSPVWESEEHIAAARGAFRDRNQHVLFPVMTGQYAEDYLAFLGADAPEVAAGDLDIIGSKVDALGYNIYSSGLVAASGEEKGYKDVPYPDDYPKTQMGWPVEPRGIYWALRFTKDYFGEVPVYIAENGMAAEDVEAASGEVIDAGRLQYLRAHLQQAERAVREGLPLTGFFVWSLLDNFEWAHGYSKRFGLVRVNYASLARTVKLSGKYYAECARRGRVL